MAKVISFSLSPKDIDRAVKELKNYQRDFKEKCQKFREMIAERVAWSASKGFTTALAGDTFEVVKGHGKDRVKTPVQPWFGADVSVTVTHGTDLSIIIADGYEATFIEYGAGKYYNGAPGSSPHEWGPQQGYLIGTYGKHHGRKDVWGYYTGPDEVTRTHGTPAAKPMYNGLKEALATIDEIAKEVFG